MNKDLIVYGIRVEFQPQTSFLTKMRLEISVDDEISDVRNRRCRN